MRAFGLIGLVVALAIVAWLAKDSLRVAMPGAGGEPAAAATTSAPPRQAVQAYEQNLKKALGDAAAARASEPAQ